VKLLIPGETAAPRVTIVRPNEEHTLNHLGYNRNQDELEIDLQDGENINPPEIG
jgi:hypothetical protein